MPASGVRTHTTARLEFDRDTYTPCTPVELPSLAVNDFMIAVRSDRVAGLADELAAGTASAAVRVNATTASATINERTTRAHRNPPERHLRAR
jgi:hypothetical protein